MRANQTFGQATAKWREAKEQTGAPSSLLRYDIASRTHLLPRFGDVQLRKLTADMLDRYYADLRKAGIADNTILWHHQLISNILRYTMRTPRWVGENVALDANPPRRRTTSVQVPEGEQVAKLIEASDRDGRIFGAFVRLAIVTGARRGELCALQWRDVDIEWSELTIPATITLGGDGYVRKLLSGAVQGGRVTGILCAMAGSVRSLPLPDDPFLAMWASALNRAGHWAYVLDANWRTVFATDEVARADADRMTSMPVGCHWFSTEWITYFTAVGGRPARFDEWHDVLRSIGPFALAAMPGGRENLRRQVDPSLADLVDVLQPVELPQVFASGPGDILISGARADIVATLFRIDDDEGHPVGVAFLLKPAVGMLQLAAAAATADLRHLERMRLVQRPDRRPAATLIADLEASSPLARRLSTAQYFSFVRRLVRTADQCIIDEGGIVGRHAGDGVVAFFLAETAGSESAAARSCIMAARALRSGLREVAARSEVPEGDVSFRFGLHWGATLYIGRILTTGRSEVTALGDEVNETARIEACATGGRTLASKSLIERLNRADADALGLDPHRTIYKLLGELPTASEKSRRDAPSIAVCDI